MRELRPEQQRSLGREQHRQRYAAYMVSPAWFARREKWYTEEKQRIGLPHVPCRGCGSIWTLKKGDLHHIDYARLGNEAHDDLWAMCKNCHKGLHQLIESSKSWRNLPRRYANQWALPVFQRQLRGETPEETQATAVASLHEYL